MLSFYHLRNRHNINPSITYHLHPSSPCLYYTTYTTDVSTNQPGGLPNEFQSCVDVLNTGRANLNESMNQIEFYGNDTIYFFQASNENGRSMNVNGSM